MPEADGRHAIVQDSGIATEIFRSHVPRERLHHGCTSGADAHVHLEHPGDRVRHAHPAQIVRLRLVGEARPDAAGDCGQKPKPHEQAELDLDFSLDLGVVQQYDWTGGADAVDEDGTDPLNDDDDLGLGFG